MTNLDKEPVIVGRLSDFLYFCSVAAAASLRSFRFQLLRSFTFHDTGMSRDAVSLLPSCCLASKSLTTSSRKVIPSTGVPLQLVGLLSIAMSGDSFGGCTAPVHAPLPSSLLLYPTIASNSPELE